MGTESLRSLNEAIFRTLSEITSGLSHGLALLT